MARVHRHPQYRHGHNRDEGPGGHFTTFFINKRSAINDEVLVDIADELEQLLGVEVGVVPGAGVNVHTRDHTILEEALDIIGDRIDRREHPRRKR